MELLADFNGGLWRVGGLKCVFIEKEQKAFLMLLLAQTALLLKAWHDGMENGGWRRL